MTEKTADVVLRSEARLVRSVNGFPFTASMTAVQSAELLDRVSFAAEGTRFALFPLSELPPQERALLVENRFLPAAALRLERENTAVVLDKECKVSALVNGQEHLCFIAVVPQLDVREVLNRVLDVEAAFARRIHFAFDEHVGYLTQSLGDVGTGLRITTVLHLPYLERAQALEKAFADIKARVNNAKLTAGGSIYLLFNNAALGQTEEESALFVSAAAQSLMDLERAAREEALLSQEDVVKEQLQDVRDKIFSAQSLTERECLQSWSLLRQGVTAGALHRTLAEVDALLSATSPGHLDAAAGRTLTPQERGANRATVFRDFVGALAPGRL